MKRHFWSILLLLTLSYWTVKPLVGSGYFSMHDDTQVSRVIVMGNAIRNGQFPVRWVSDLGYGYGYPLYNFYGPLPYYVGGGLYAAGIPAVTATKMMMGIGMILSVVFMYLLAGTIFGRLAGILSAVLYLYAPYHAVQLYVRGAVGELWAYALLPLLFLGIFLCKDPRARKHGVWIGGLGLGGIILSHTITGYVTVVFYLIALSLYSLMLLLRKKFHVSFIIHHSLLLLVGLGLSAFFWLPAFVEMSYTNVAGQIGGSANFLDHFVCIPQLWNSLWGYGGSVAGCIDGMSFKVGKIHVLLGVLGLGISIFRLRSDFWNRPIGLMSIIGLVLVMMVTPYWRFIWELIPGLAYVQYPWRLLSGIVLACALLGGSVIYWVSLRWFRMAVVSVVIVSVIFINEKLFVPQYRYEKSEGYFESQEDLAWRVSKISDEYMPPSFSKPTQPGDIAREILVSDSNRGFTVEQEIITEVYAKLHVQSNKSTEVVLNRAYFPGWQYWVNGVVQPLRILKGLPQIELPASGSVVELRFGGTTVRHLGNIISLFVLLSFISIYGKKSIA